MSFSTKVPLPLKTEGPIEDITAISWQVGSETKTRYANVNPSVTR